MALTVYTAPRTLAVRWTRPQDQIAMYLLPGGQGYMPLMTHEYVDNNPGAVEWCTIMARPRILTVQESGDLDRQELEIALPTAQGEPIIRNFTLREEQQIVIREMLVVDPYESVEWTGEYQKPARPGHEACDLDRTCTGGPYECLQAAEGQPATPVGVTAATGGPLTPEKADELISMGLMTPDYRAAHQGVPLSEIVAAGRLTRHPTMIIGSAL